MKFAKNIKEIEFNTVTMYGEEIEIGRASCRERV